VKPSRTWAIARKEFIHIYRDPRSLALVILMPVILMLLFGYAVTLDVKAELCAGCGVCVEACPYDVIRLKGRWEAGSKPTVVYVTE
jgi:ferredoxin